MIKWQSEAIRALLSESDNAKPWGYLIDIENDTIKDIWGVAASLSMDAINAKATELKNASEYIDNRVGITSGYAPIEDQLDQSEYHKRFIAKIEEPELLVPDVHTCANTGNNLSKLTVLVVQGLSLFPEPLTGAITPDTTPFKSLTVQLFNL